jgi:soluble lytic murein transglycosylase
MNVGWHKASLGLGLILTLAFSSAATEPTAFAQQVFYYQDEQGGLFFSDLPEHQGYKEYGNPKRHSKHPQTIGDYIGHYAKHYQVDPLLVRAIIKVESNFEVRAVSHRGAQGLMQLMPETAQDYGLSDPFDPEQNIRAGVSYLCRLLSEFNGDLRFALAAYNAGPTTVKRLGGIPPYRETIDYIQQVLGYYQRLKSYS